jgi:hypothetical protein
MFNGAQKLSGLHQFYRVHFKIILQLPTVISAMSHVGYCVPPCLLLKNSRFCTHSVFMCFEQTSETGKFPYTTVSCWFLQYIVRNFRAVNQNLYICIYVSMVSSLKRQCHGSGSYILMSDGGLNQILT